MRHVIVIAILIGVFASTALAQHGSNRSSISEQRLSELALGDMNLSFCYEILDMLDAGEARERAVYIYSRGYIWGRWRESDMEGGDFRDGGRAEASIFSAFGTEEILLASLRLYCLQNPEDPFYRAMDDFYENNEPDVSNE